ncbi:hypothetical protein N0V90_007168 [Kalmusia sp. IMI 367209]|nr:hypothetical protein N0V90_007168 [Kalmusia sp. IMI 367209]
MFKPTPCMQKTLRRLPLSPKQAGKEYYKGNRVGKMGTINKYGQFHPDYSRIRTFVYPAKGTKGFELTPFVSSRASMFIQEGEKKWATVPKEMTGEEYLARWKAEGGHDTVDVPVESVQAQGKMPEVWEGPKEEVKKS